MRRPASRLPACPSVIARSRSTGCCPTRASALWGRTHDRPRVSLCGVRVDDVEAARAALEGAGVRVLRDAAGALVLDPDTTGGIEVAVVDQLLPGDPRR